MMIFRSAGLHLARALASAFLLFLSSTIGAANGQSPGHLEIRSEIAVTSDVIPQWCYDAEPGFVFVHERSLYRANLAGESELLQTLDSPIDDLSLRCSLDGKVIFFLSALHEFAYVVQDDAISKYGLRKDFAETGIGYSSLMSPDGTTFVLGVERLLSGPDVLADKSILDPKSIGPHSGDIFWTKQYMIRPSGKASPGRSQEFSFQQIGDELDRGNTRRLRLPAGVSADNIAECGSRTYVVTFGDETDKVDAEMFTIDRPNARTRMLPGRLIGELNSTPSGCLLPIMSESRGIYHADRLLLLVDKSRQTFKLPSERYFDSRFYLSKDLNYALTYESILPRSEHIRGRIVVLQIIPPKK